MSLLLFALFLMAVGAALLVVGILVFLDYRNWGSTWVRSVNEGRRSLREGAPSILRRVAWLPEVGPSAGELLGFMLVVAGIVTTAIGLVTLVLR